MLWCYETMVVSCCLLYKSLKYNLSKQPYVKIFCYDWTLITSNFNNHD